MSDPGIELCVDNNFPSARQSFGCLSKSKMGLKMIFNVFGHDW